MRPGSDMGEVDAEFLGRLPLQGDKRGFTCFDAAPRGNPPALTRAWLDYAHKEDGAGGIDEYGPDRLTFTHPDKSGQVVLTVSIGPKCFRDPIRTNRTAWVRSAVGAKVSG
jgi:hypothetical protein